MLDGEMTEEREENLLKAFLKLFFKAENRKTIGRLPGALGSSEEHFKALSREPSSL